MKLIITIVALVVALLVAFAVSGVISDKPEETQQVSSRPVQTVPAKVPETYIYIASKDIEIGEVVTKDHFEERAWPTRLLPPNPIKTQGGPTAIEGFIASAPIVRGEPMIGSKLRNPNDPSFIAGQLGENMRAITISVNLVDSVAGFVSPGDAVDVLFTFDMDKTSLDTGDLAATGGEEENRVSISEVLLANVKILAVDRRVTNTTKDGKAPPVPASVTLAVNQRDAQKLKLGERIGQLSLALRSLADVEKTDAPRPSAEQDLTRLLPPAYFPALFDSDAPYDYNVIDLYGRSEKPALEEDSSENDISVEREDPFVNVDIYCGTDVDSVEVNRQ